MESAFSTVVFSRPVTTDMAEAISSFIIPANLSKELIILKELDKERAFCFVLHARMDVEIAKGGV